MSSAAPTLPPRGGTTQLRARRSPRLVLVGLLIMCLGGLGAAVLYASVTTSRPVLVANRTVVRGETIKESDLRITELGGARVAAVDANRLREVVGKVALLDIGEGSVLTPASYGQVSVNAGTSQLGLRLAPGRVPVRDMPAGTPVRIIGVPAKTDQAAAASDAFVTAATVVTSPQATPDGAAVMLDVEVPADKAVILAQLAAADRLVVVREPVK
ncbi:MAG TPA: SAF domain-containing protein [Propionibacteriaceae bacterium]|nr:SAF domain-containing protein [Propionibacteriaceae bacterium]